ncbi:MAG: LPXTG cell wall anchor domain-containing protein [Acidimicrobiales bacterium]
MPNTGGESALAPGLALIGLGALGLGVARKRTR